MTETTRYACKVCTRTDLSLTANGRIRSHAANGKRTGPDNPTCPGGSDLPREKAPEDLRILPSGGPNPHRAPLPNHVHRYEYGDDGNGHSGSFCAVCGGRELDTHDLTEDPWNATSSSQQNWALAPGSSPHTTESAPDAGTPSSKETVSRPTEPAGTQHGSAAVTEPSSVADVFESAVPVKRDKDPKRDRYGRYLLPHPVTGKRQAWTRATTMAKSISDTFALAKYGERMTAKGLAMRPDLVALAGTLDVKEDKDRLNSLVEQAKDAAGQKVAANLGTAVHSFTEQVDAGGSLEEVPVLHQPDVAAYTAAMRKAGLRPVPHLIERITVVPEFGTAGTLDRVLRTGSGDYVIGDVKTARTLEYGWQEIAIQLALYAHGVNEAGVWDMENDVWEPNPLWTPGPGDSAPKVRTDYGIVMHLPIGEKTCTLYRVDLEQGWTAAAMCADVRGWRKARNLAEPYMVAEPDGLTCVDGYVAPIAVRAPTWAERFVSVSSRGEAAALYNEAARVFETRSPELAGLVKLAQERLASLEEPAG